METDSELIIRQMNLIGEQKKKIDALVGALKKGIEYVRVASKETVGSEVYDCADYDLLEELEQALKDAEE